MSGFMIHLSVYKLVHLVGVLSLFLALGSILGSEKSGPRWSAPLHGLALVAIAISGFGLLARSGVHSFWPTWVVGKMGLWVLFGMSLALAKRRILPRFLLVPVVLSFGGLAASLALWKP